MMRLPRVRGARGLVAAVAALATVTGAGAKPPPTAEALNRYLIGLPALTAKPGSDNPAGPTTTSTSTDGPTKYECRSTPRTLASNPSDIIALNADAGKLWLGALLQGSGYVGGPGSLAELPIRDRAPLTIYIDLPGKHISTTVKTPTAATVQQAINNLVAAAEKAQKPQPAGYDARSWEAHSVDQALLNAGISVKYLGVKANASLTTSHTVEESSYLVTVTQRMFTVNIVPPDMPAGYFGPRYTVADLKKQAAAGRIGRSNPPVVVSHIVYGRKLIFTVTAKSKAEDLKASVDAAYTGPALSGSANVSPEQRSILNSASYGVVALGGDESNARALIASYNVSDYLKQGNALSSAVPIAYQVDNVVNGTAAAFSETTNYNLTTCTAIPPAPVVVGEVIQLDNLRGYVAGPCTSPSLVGAVYINGTNVWTAPSGSPIDGPVKGDFVLTQSPLSPRSTVPGYKVHLEAGQVALLNTPNLNTVPITGNIAQKVWLGSWPLNVYNGALTYPAKEGENYISGGSAHCKVDLKVNVHFVQNIYDTDRLTPQSTSD